MEIIETLKEMRSDFERDTVLRQCRFGFCYYLTKRKIFAKDEILAELSKETKIHKDKLCYCYWYPIFNDKLSKELSIQPRIDHLTRTINRLETP